MNSLPSCWSLPDQNCGADSGGNELTNAMNNGQQSVNDDRANAPVNASARQMKSAEKLISTFPSSRTFRPGLAGKHRPRHLLRLRNMAISNPSMKASSPCLMPSPRMMTPANSASTQALNITGPTGFCELRPTVRLPTMAARRNIKV